MSDDSIRKMTDSDLDMVLEWRNHIDVRKYMFTQHVISWVEHKSWYERCLKIPTKHLLVFQLQGTPHGFISFSQIEGGKIADWGFYTAPIAPRGTGQLLGKEAINFAFTNLGLCKICGQALSYNEKSINFHLRFGFQQEKILRVQDLDERNARTVICFGLLKNDWYMNQKGKVYVG
ncbi:UDP-4-amino-4,6-dideoxy-N-acetyl-beta-L-altrosamine N-acetyltransferase [uncultured Microbulbifer sp.]|uniref:UDP-4-amino-4, 6-dideoxy-N-acetyl-beta-L-altrosamine N-acetyltransferase n=1 Tax=uncultured Microbulbifer sp. TaxID=348147 RepID=UPI00262BFEE0|nr:UDP-4-amino-4,6-dideoxy-N-acetyl-beta-L-altrosamine N-acetyltransferase [uncultured Microbulbifer sp.]